MPGPPPPALAFAPVAEELGRRFAAEGHALALVGGPVRDALLGRVGTDLDFTTDARPEQVLRVLKGWAEAVWDVGIAFGTVGARRDGWDLEITTYRSESYDRESRKPEVAYGDSLEGDLLRRDFRVNAMAVALPALELVDPFDGRADLAARVLRTPGAPEDSFSDDPLRMLRAARFASQLGFAVAPEVLDAMRAMAGRLEIVSAERVQAELSKLLLGAHPRAGLRVLVETGLAEVVLPELPALALEIDEHHRHKDVYEHTLTVLEQAIALEPALPGGGPDLVLRLAALLHDIGKPRTRTFEDDGGVSFHFHEVVGARMARSRLKALRYDKQTIEDVSRLVELHLRFHGYAEGAWTDAAVRRYVRDAGPLLERLHALTRSDSTTRNKRKAAALQAAYDSLVQRIAELREQEEIDALRPDLDGNEIMALLGVPPGPVVGRAYKHLLELRTERGPLPREEAEAELRAWYAQQAG
ncbi:poly(A) polymerase [Motilibacter rhizosphaerae]|uniref:Poly(A) polymerase n=1 Tax=Motilibacter rhizosphaerae TaxID=598652 RepID=A0A4Q7NVE2_9ACTN|nr:CCA tRNA nucleotidyltransferase [Motilibacter rhizosphaerae]RZS91211.1 poly(A) polymerase [Motilibacter rhizosphaerae]